MKKIPVLILLMLSLSIFSQSPFAEKGHNLTLGYGFPNLYKTILRSNVANQQMVLVALGSGNASTYSYRTTGIDPLFLKYEYGLTEHIGFGLILGYSSAALEETHDYEETWYNQATKKNEVRNYTDITTLAFQSASIGARFNYHFTSKRKFDPYLGFGAGYTHATAEVSHKSNNPNSFLSVRFANTNPFPIYLGLTFGIRYYFTNNIGIYGEVGLDKWAVIQGGLAFKFN